MPDPEILRSALTAAEIVISTIKMRKIVSREIRVSPGRMEREVSRLARSVRMSDFNPGVIIGLGGDRFTGGCITGALLASAKHLSKPFYVLEVELPPHRPRAASLAYVISQVPQDCSILVVDDIVKRGETLRNSIDALVRDGAFKGIQLERIRAATMFRFDARLVASMYQGRLPALDEAFWARNFCNTVTRKDLVRFPWYA